MTPKAFGYLRTNHWIDAVSSLEAAHKFSAQAASDERFWKWLLIAVHSSVQGFMALALEQGNSLLVMRDDVLSKWQKTHEAGTPYPDEKMDSFLSLYEKVKSDAVCGYVGSKPFVPGVSHNDSMRKLNEIRNNFIHFFPMIWSIQLAGLPKICTDCLDVAHFLGWESMTIIWNDSVLSERGQNACTQLRTALQSLDATY